MPFKQTKLTAVTGSNLSTITIDCNLFETHTYNSDITENPIEDGTTVIDHSVQIPVRLDIEAIIVGGKFDGADETAQERFEVIDTFRKEAALLYVTTPQTDHDNMLISSLRVSKTSEIGEAIRFSMSLKQVTIVNSLEVSTTAPSQSATKENARVDTSTASADSVPSSQSGTNTLGSV